MAGKFFFQGPGIVREFCDVSRENEILYKKKYQGNVREVYISTVQSLECLDVSFLLKS